MYKHCVYITVGGFSSEEMGDNPNKYEIGYCKVVSCCLLIAPFPCFLLCNSNSVVFLPSNLSQFS